MKSRFLYRIIAVLFTLVCIDGAAAAQQAGSLVGGLGTSIFNVTPMTSGQLMIGQGPAQNPLSTTLSGDCTLTAGGVIICTKQNGATYGSAATANTGTSGSNVPLLNTINTWSALQTFNTHIAAGTGTPVLSSCGGGSPTIAGDDKDGLVTMGTTATGCVITFNAAYSAVPFCTVSWQATPLGSQSYTITASAITTVQTSTSSNKLNYHCTAQNGG